MTERALTFVVRFLNDIATGCIERAYSFKESTYARASIFLNTDFPYVVKI